MNNTDIFHKCFNYKRADEAKAAGYYPYFKPIQSGADTEVFINGKKMIMIGSNNYLGLTQDQRVKEAAIKAIEKYGSGCTGSRFLNGTLDIHEELEHKLAEFMQKPACLVFSTGFQTNQGVISTVVGKDDTVIIDRGNHASIVDGCRLSFGKTVKYKHNDMADLERILAELPNPKNALIVVDGVFSMEGDLANLPEIVRLKKRFGARLMVDDAHGIGVLGAHGRGAAEHFGLENEVDLIMGTFSKSFASLGGFIVGEAPVISYIKHHARALIFSASMPPSAVATVITALKILQTEPERRERLWQITRRMQNDYKKLGFNIGPTQTPIIPLIFGEDMLTFNFWRNLFDKGVFSNPVISPAVPPDGALIRTSYMATHTDEELDKVLSICKEVGTQLGVLK
ncbi:MAG: aminotransferase class I/II-fold pyridoxal phosphate-dependent enzyme [Planctomycetes bacterium]|nr:aminotransferase class I/II-fold pyridoxal phosphate-dependent enzyme [Planctomycetota bacterium]